MLDLRNTPRIQAANGLEPDENQSCKTRRQSVGKLLTAGLFLAGIVTETCRQVVAGRTAHRRTAGRWVWAAESI